MYKRQPEGVEEERRAFALAHEAMHARRRDLWRKALLLWVCALHWFNPLVWLLRRAAERDMEIACDAAVLAGREDVYKRQVRHRGRGIRRRRRCRPPGSRQRR